METIGADAYAMTISAGVASIKGTYAGEVALTDPDPPHSFVLRARGQGAPGTVDATVRVRLAPDDSAGTRVDYDADAIVGGMIGGVGQRMLSTVAKRTAGEFFAAVEQALAEPVAAVPAPAPEAARPEQPEALRPEQPGPAQRPVYTAPPRSARPDGAVAWAMTAAFAAGGAMALAGVALGYLMGRRSRR
jgi:carbon monoxide dehydrogenase subunit G